METLKDWFFHHRTLFEPQRIDLGNGAWLVGRILDVRRPAGVSVDVMVVALADFQLELPIDTDLTETLSVIWLDLRRVLTVAPLPEELRPPNALRHNKLDAVRSMMVIPPWIERPVDSARRLRQQTAVEAAGDDKALAGIAFSALAEGFTDVFARAVARSGSAYRPYLLHPTMFRRVIAHNRPRIGAWLIQSGADPRQCPDIASALVDACHNGHLQIVEMLLRAGLDPNAPNVDGRAPLEAAVEQGHPSVVACLISAGATRSGALLDRAIRSDVPRVLSALIRAGLDPDRVDENGLPLIFQALAPEAHPGLFRELVAAGARLDVTRPDGRTLLAYAVENRRIDAVRALLVNGAPLNEDRLEGHSLLDYAQHRNLPDIAALLRIAGAKAVQDPEIAAPFDARYQERTQRRARHAEAERDLFRRQPAYLRNIDRRLMDRAAPYIVHTGTPTHQIVKIRLRRDGEERRPRTPDRALDLIGSDVETRWGPAATGLGADQIAAVRAKLTYLFGDPNDTTDEYKISFSYWLIAEVDNVAIDIVVADWKARRVASGYRYDNASDEALQCVDRAFWDLMTRAPLADFEAKFTYDTYRGVRYGCKNGVPDSDFPS